MSRRVLLLLLALPLGLRGEDFQGAYHQLEYEGETIKYSETAPADPIAQLQHRVASGETVLPYDEQFGYLPALLSELRIPAASQLLVFSKTSFQRRLISPDNPRALYFNDSAYLAYLPGSETLEAAAVDPQLGPVFYRFANEKVRRPRFERDRECLQCHGTTRTLGVPGFFTRSIGTDATGELETLSEVNNIDQCTPLADRWAGFFVTGEVGRQTHRGNLIGTEALARLAGAPNPRANLTDLGRLTLLPKYLEPTSDVVSLLLLEHQAKMHNYLTRLNYEARMMMATYGHIRYLTNQVNAFLRYLLFVEEAPLTSPIAGRPELAQAFTALGPFDAKGRCLRELDLQTRLLKYPCSYLIYSPAFDALPSPMHELLLERLHAILTNQDADPQFARLSAESRQAILEIVRETKPNLPASWYE